MDLTPITDRITADAKNRVKSIKAETEREIAHMFDLLEEERQSLKKQKQQELDRRKAELETAFSAAQRKLKRDAFLKARSEALKSVVTRSKEEFVKSKEYNDFLKEQYKKIGASGEIMLNERDLSRISAESFPGSKVSIVPVKISGGFIMETESVTYNCTLDSLFDEKIREIERAAENVFNQMLGEDCN